MTLAEHVWNNNGLVGSIIALLVLLGDFLFWRYKKTLSLKISKAADDSSVRLTVLNKRDFNIEIEHVRLIMKRSIFNKYEFDECSYYCLVESEEFGFRSTQNDKLNIIITPQDPIFNFEIKYSDIFNLYHKFVGYKSSDDHQLGEINKFTKMPTCCIGIFLKGGKCIYINIPSFFYTYYKHEVGVYYNSHLAELKGECLVKIGFDSEESYQRYKNKLLNSYKISKKNEYLLYK